MSHDEISVLSYSGESLLLKIVWILHEFLSESLINYADYGKKCSSNKLANLIIVKQCKYVSKPRLMTSICPTSLGSQGQLGGSVRLIECLAYMQLQLILCWGEFSPFSFINPIAGTFGRPCFRVLNSRAKNNVLNLLCGHGLRGSEKVLWINAVESVVWAVCLKGITF